MAKKKLADYISEWVDAFEGYELHRTEFVKEGGDWFLRVFVDKLEGDGYGIMSTDDCEAVSRYLSDLLDEADPIVQNYTLEVSSPGMDRPLISDKDFERFAGEAVEIRLYEAIEGKKQMEAKLVSRENGFINIEDEKGNALSLPVEKVAKINLAVVF